MLFNGNRSCGCSCNEYDYTDSCACGSMLGGCGCATTNNTCNNSCNSTPYNSCNNTCGNTNPTPLYLPETVECSNVTCCHEQPVIVPIERRTVVHHGYVPRYYQTVRYTREDVYDDNNALGINGLGTNGLGINGIGTGINSGLTGCNTTNYNTAGNGYYNSCNSCN